LRAENGKGSEKEAKKDGLGGDQEIFQDTEGVKVPVEGGFEEQSAFIEFDHGTPADPESDSEDDGSGSESEQGDDDEHSGQEEGDEDEDEDEEMSDSTETGKHELPRQSPHESMSEGDDDDGDEVLGIVM